MSHVTEPANEKAGTGTRGWLLDLRPHSLLEQS